MRCDILLTACICYILLPRPSLVSGCEEGWFGTKCMLPCQCDNAIDCGLDNDCNGKCKPHQFGPECQYRDMLHGSDQEDHGLTDGDDTTCIIDEIPNIELTLNSPTMFSWMRLVTKDPGKFDTLSVTLKGKTKRDVIGESRLKRVHVTDRILDIYGGSATKRIHSIEMKWIKASDAFSFCSVYFSGGRNVALRQNAQQFSTLQGDSSADKAIDGNMSTCAKTQLRPANDWKLKLSTKMKVDSLNISDEDLRSACWLSHLHLDMNNSNSKLFSYKDPGTSVDKMFRLISPDSYLQGVSSVRIYVAQENWAEEGKCFHSPGISLCEVTVYGDYDCPIGTWNHECKTACGKCMDIDQCVVPTGACLSGCEAGYKGYRCFQKCDDGEWGSGCINTCSKQCADGKCKPDNGACIGGCLPGYDSVFCDRPCEVGKWGDRCAKRCGKHCAGDKKCHHVKGTCTAGCQPGYTTAFCDKPCAQGNWGSKCARTCSKTCGGDGSCDHVNGTCLHGCKQGYTDRFCLKSLPVAAAGINKGTIIISAILLVLFLMGLVLGVWMFRKQKRSGQMNIESVAPTTVDTSDFPAEDEPVEMEHVDKDVDKDHGKDGGPQFGTSV